MPSALSFDIDIEITGGLSPTREESILTFVVRSVFVLILVLTSFPLLSSLLRSGDNYLGELEDDLFYYIVIAKHILAQGFSSFDGITHTNGYHPLWMGVIICLVWIFGTGKALFAAIALCAMASAILTFEIFLAVVRKHFRLSYTLAGGLIIGSKFMVQIELGGMEVILTLPLLAYTLYRLSGIASFSATSRKEWCVLGLLSSALVLSRLDSFIFVAMFAITYILLDRRSAATRGRLLLYFLIGLLPLVLYFMWNIVSFGSLMTISAQAKQLQHGHHVSLSMLHFFWTYRYGKLTLLTVPLALVLNLWCYRTLITAERIVCLLILLFPLIYFTVYILRISWYIYEWYFYSVPFALTIALYTIFENVRQYVPRRFHRIEVVVFVACALISLSDVGALFRSEPQPVENSKIFYPRAKELQSFANAHPGTYAMGDYAGITAFLTNVPIIQLEGLAADERMVQHIDREDDLLQVLRDYHVDYLIEASHGEMHRDPDGYHVRDPHLIQSGSAAKYMATTIDYEPMLSLAPAPVTRLSSPKRENLMYGYVFPVR